MLNEDIEALRNATREFSEKEVTPLAQKLHLSQEQIPDSLIEKMREMGLFGVNAPAEHGGLGLGATAIAVVTEELSKAWFSVGSLPLRNWVAIRLLQTYGTSQQKEKWLDRFVSGELQAAHAGTEPDAGSDAANVKTRATRDGNIYRLNGSKQWCTHANRADVLLTYCRTGETSSRHGGISLLLVEKPRGDAFVPPKLTGNRLHTAGYHGMHSYQLFFDDYEVPAGNLLGEEEGRAFKQLMAVYELARLQFSFRCIGLAQAAYEAALEYSKVRVQFGQPIARFQAIRFKLADMATSIQAARQLGLLVAARMDAGERVDLEAGMAKLFASEMAQRVCREAVQIHGGNGFAVDYPVNRYWLDSGLLTIGEGTSEVQREVIARKLLGER